SLDNTVGNRYFDFEMYQTDIYYDRVSSRWYGFGPYEGHSRWEFDAAGNILKPGDIIFSAQYQSSTLTNIEARIWVEKTTWQTITPVSFNWSGLFDGASAGATYGYASITPKTAGAFYTGMGSSNNTWAGPFRLVLQDNSMATNYSRDQFMEFSVNLSKLGLDPAGMIGGDICGTPFNRIVVKTRASASFTAELKDFVAPTDLFLAPRVDIITETPFICDTIGIARIDVSNPVPTSYYEWSTPNGNIVGSNIGTFIIVDTPGIYICTQRLQAGCSLYASDTIEIFPFLPCDILAVNLHEFNGFSREGIVRLNWKVFHDELVDRFEIERSTDGIHFNVIGQVQPETRHGGSAEFTYSDSTGTGNGPPYYYYRVKLYERYSHGYTYSPVIRLAPEHSPENDLQLVPNPVRDFMQIHITAKSAGSMRANLYDLNGKLVLRMNRELQTGNNVVAITGIADMPPGVYSLVVETGNRIFSRKLMKTR
ncbi:MAG: T9SS type A sorting domain-containing protein, partial [Chitinophagaceae bacterium]